VRAETPQLQKCGEEDLDQAICFPTLFVKKGILFPCSFKILKVHDRFVFDRISDVRKISYLVRVKSYRMRAEKLPFTKQKQPLTSEKLRFASVTSVDQPITKNQ
jgi:hypothetical protein